MRQILLFVFLTIHASVAGAQKNDYHYLNQLGEEGGVQLSWNEAEAKLDVGIIDGGNSIANPAMVISNSGRMLGYFDSINLFDSIGRLAINGEDFNLKGFTTREIRVPVYGKTGYITAQYSAVLPLDNDSTFVLISNVDEGNYGQAEFLLPELYDEEALHNIYSEAVYYSIIRLREDGRLEVEAETKETLMLSGFLRAEIAACRHANGKDWWVIISNITDDQAHKFLIDDSGFRNMGTFTLSNGNTYCYPNAGMVRFSPDGSKMVRTHHRVAYSAIKLPDVIEVWNFNRCTGEVEGESIVGIMPLPIEKGYGFSIDAEFSPSGRFLYFANGPYLIQFDLEEEFPFENGDTIRSWNGEIWRGLNHVFFSNFWRMPDGKLLVNYFNITPYLHIIHEPDRKGSACHFEYKAMTMPTNPSNRPYEFPIPGLPKSPDYRMEALDIDCTTPTREESEMFQRWILYPNPFRSEFILELSNLEIGSIEIYDLLGRQLSRKAINTTSSRILIEAHSWSSGVHIVVLKDSEGHFVGSQKVIKQ